MGVFRFKQFTVCDDRATMKVGTDAVLLGAWVDISLTKNILDIGTGSGIIALMMGQRTGPDVKIDAVELLEQDAQQASENISKSPWPGKISVSRTSIQEFYPGRHYDRIICNPPYFSKSLLPPTGTRSKVRHDTALTSDDLLTATGRLLSPMGKLCLILPFVESVVFIQKANSMDLFLHHVMKFFTRQGKAQERTLMEFGFKAEPLREDSSILYQSKNQWTKEYRKLTQDFYLDQ